MKPRKKTVPFVFACLMLVLVVIAWAAVWQWEKCQELLFYQHAIRYDQQSFHKVIGKADRIVVRDGGFDCCHPVDDEPVLFVVTNMADIHEIAAHLQFQPVTTTNSFWESCMCCGHPGIDWFVGTKRLALTSVQHSDALRWKGFSTGRILGWKVGYGDAPLTKESASWLASWLSKHESPEKITTP